MLHVVVLTLVRSQRSRATGRVRRDAQVRRHCADARCTHAASSSHVAHLALQAVKQIATHFKGYNAVDRIAVVTRRVQEVQGRLRTMLDEDFEHLCVLCRHVALLTSEQHAARPGETGQTFSHTRRVLGRGCHGRRRQVCRVRGSECAFTIAGITSLKSTARWSSRSTVEYSSPRTKCVRNSRRGAALIVVGRPARQRVATLCVVPTRPHYLRGGALVRISRILGNRPTPMRQVLRADAVSLPRAAIARFTERGRDDLVGVLQKAAPTLTVTLLLESLQHVLDFEAFVSKKYKVPVMDVLKVITYPVHAPKTLSSAFEPHMGVFVDAQDKCAPRGFLAHRLTRAGRSRTCSRRTAGLRRARRSTSRLGPSRRPSCPRRRSCSTFTGRTWSSARNCRPRARCSTSARCTGSGCGYTQVRTVARRSAVCVLNRYHKRTSSLRA